MHKSFLVHFIDYGNKEEITKIRSLSEELLQKCCYLVRCEKPFNLSFTEFEKFLGDQGAEVTVLKVDGKAAELYFHYNTKYSMMCYPCFSDSASEIEAAVSQDSSVFSEVSPASKVKKGSCTVNDSKEVIEISTTSKVSSPSTNISPSSKFKKSLQSENFKAIAEKITVPKILSTAVNYSVRVLFIKTASELFVLLIEDEVAMNNMVKNLNSFCNSNKSSYIPSIGEIVSCKFRDGAWYRGKVMKKLNNKYLISFIDYGNEDTVSQNDIQVLFIPKENPLKSNC